MRTHTYQNVEGVIALLRQVPRSVWIALAVTALLIVLALGWAAVVAVQWLLGQDPALAGQAAAWLGQGAVEHLEQWIPGAGARLEEAAAAISAPAAEPVPTEPVAE